MQVTPQYAFTELAWPQEVTDDDVPGLDSLIRWLQQEGNGVEKHYHITRNSFTNIALNDHVVTLAGRRGRNGREGLLGFAGDDGFSVRRRKGMQGARSRRGALSLIAGDGANGRRGQ